MLLHQYYKPYYYYPTIKIVVSFRQMAHIPSKMHFIFIQERASRAFLKNHEPHDVIINGFPHAAAVGYIERLCVYRLADACWDTCERRLPLDLLISLLKILRSSCEIDIGCPLSRTFYARITSVQGEEDGTMRRVNFQNGFPRAVRIYYAKLNAAVQDQHACVYSRTKYYPFNKYIYLR